MKNTILLISILCLSILYAATPELYQDFGGGVNVRFESLRESPMQKNSQGQEIDEEFPDTPMISRTLAFPYQEADLSVSQMTWRVFSKDGEYLSSRSEIVDDSVVLSPVFTFREMRGVTLKIQTQRETDTEILTLDNLDLNIRGNGTIDMPQSLSPAFVQAYEYLADNWNTSYLKSLPIARPKMLIISHPQLANYQAGFIQWKRSLGYDVFVLNRADIGSSLQEIRDAIHTHYTEHQADYLLLLGDTVGNFSIPTNFYPSPEYAENDADDFYYTLLEGDDYFPEMLVGRFSFTDIMEFIVMTTKTVSYEQEPFMADTSWMTRALVIAGNYAEGNLRPTTPVWMSRWLRERLLDYGYAEVDTVFYPPSYPGTSMITQSINDGVQFISYRGWGDANGWHYPSFHIPDLNSTFNSSKMPIVYSIVCNTGDFANSVNPSFGEKWMRMGTTASLGGCVAFVGPSDLHTKTRLNNTISSGAYRSIMDWDVRGFGTSVLMGKMELYKNFPNDLEPGQYVPFYFHVYNILSDPSMNMWSLVPNVIDENVIEGGLTFSQSDSYIRVLGSHLDGAIVSGTKDGENFSYARVIQGMAVLNIDPEQEGDLTITVSKPDWVPLVRTLTATEATGIGVVDNTGMDTTINAHETKMVDITVKNFSDSALNGVSASIIEHPNFTITALNSEDFDLPPDATHTLQYQIKANNQVHPGDFFNLDFRTSNPDSRHIFQMAGGGARLTVVNHSGILELGQNSQISLSVLNSGTTPMQNAEVVVESLTEAANVPSSAINLGNIAVAQEMSFDLNIDLMPEVWDGRNIPLKFSFSDDQGYQWIAYYALTAGNPSTDDPTGPCPYGYFIYDNTDADYDMVPTYEWVELDPELGGQGNLWLIMDDGVKQVDLPFNFRFYGQDYNSLTMSSNGWVSFIHTAESYFNNHYIPAALGPYAMIAGYWDDLKGMKTGVDNNGDDVFADMRILYWYDEANNRYIVQWNEAYNQYTIQAGQDASLEKFQIILYPRDGEDGDIVIQYHTVDNPAVNGNYATVGIEDHLQRTGLTYTYGNAYPQTAAILEAGRAIRFTTTAPDSYVSNEDAVASVPVKNLRNYPNPFNPSTVIAFESSKADIASLQVFNTKGQLVKAIHDGAIKAGTNSFVWDGTDSSGKTVASGIYFYRLRNSHGDFTRKMLMMK